MPDKPSFAVRRDRIFIAWAPVIISVVFFIVINIYYNRNDFIISGNDGIENFKTMLSVWGTLLGFILTAVSILLTLGDGKFLGILKATGHFKTVLYSYVVCCIHLFIATVFAIVCIFGKIWGKTIFSIMCSMTVDTMLMVAICLLFLFMLISRVND